jgi:hypothetical protein
MVRGHRLPQVYGIIGGPDGGPGASAAVVDWLPPSEAGDHHPRQATMAQLRVPSLEGVVTTSHTTPRMYDHRNQCLAP